MRGACEHGLVECKACGHFNEENSLDADFVVPNLSPFSVQHAPAEPIQEAFHSSDSLRCAVAHGVYVARYR